ncbi:MAG: NADPH-dependent 7-cyano-7-deazaguanine reductase QueF [Fibrobacteria bacterium]|nr:NADPH-dependent 7-cyano-7-deazaguanine reductase QueF [Fibrobacteria bacterium]
MTEKKTNADQPQNYEGLQHHIPELKTPSIDTWEFQYPESQTSITVSIPEFTCICPKTGLPDFATLFIEYVPFEHCLELKSLKEYMFSYRDVGVFHEHVVNKVLDDCVKACKPRKMEIKGVFNMRGGIQTTALAIFTKR